MQIYHGQNGDNVFCLFQESKIEFMSGSDKLEGQVVHKKSLKKKAPVVVVLPAEGILDDYSISMAQNAAELGYIGFAVDLSGENPPGIYPAAIIIIAVQIPELCTEIIAHFVISLLVLTSILQPYSIM